MSRRRRAPILILAPLILLGHNVPSWCKPDGTAEQQAKESARATWLRTRSEDSAQSFVMDLARSGKLAKFLPNLALQYQKDAEKITSDPRHLQNMGVTWDHAAEILDKVTREKS